MTTTIPSLVVVREASPPAVEAPRARRRPPVVLAEAGAAVAAAAVAAGFVGSTGAPAASAALAWVVLAYARVSRLRGPVPRRYAPLWRAGGLVVLLFGGLAMLLDVPQEQAAAALAAVCAACATAVGVRRVGTVVTGPCRVVLAGDHSAFRQHEAGWSDRDDVRVVGLAPVAGDDASGWAGLEALPGIVEETAADVVVLVRSAGELVRQASWSLEHSGVDLVVLGDVPDVARHRLARRSVGGVRGVQVDPARPTARFVKHALDRVLGVALLAALAPLLAVIGAAVRLESRGPAFFRQTRVGRDGRPFTILKIRTMVDGADELKHMLRDRNEADGALFKMRHDPRTTRLGTFLRRSSLDELPQLVNVVLGQMSLIGPRPFVPSEVAEMDGTALRRLVVRPGMTGLWQVNGRCALGWEDSLALDVYYADNWGLLTDLRIAARTVTAVMSGRGAC